MVTELIAEHGSPLWLADVDRVHERARDFAQVWRRSWPACSLAYSYKTNRLLAFLRAIDEEGYAPEVVTEAEYMLAREVIGAPGESLIVNGPAKAPSLLARAGLDDALVVVDSEAELSRAAAAGVRRVGLRVSAAGFTGAVSRFGIPAGEVLGAALHALDLGLQVETLSLHSVSTDFTGSPAEGNLAAQVSVRWPHAAAVHARAAGELARLAGELARAGVLVGTLDLGGGLPPAPGVAAHAREIATALRGEAFSGRLLIEPGRAIVSDAVDLACSVVAEKTLADGARCVVVDAGTNHLPGTLWSWPRIEAADAPVGSDTSRALVSGPLCLNVDILCAAAELPALRPGDVLLVRDVGAYQQVHATQFGELRPAVVARAHGSWSLARRRETLGDLIAGEQDFRLEHHPTEATE